MAMLSTKQSLQGLRAPACRRAVPAKGARAVRVCASADRPLWFPGNPAPAHLTGELAGDYGFDPLRLSQEPETRKWFVQAELVNGRWAMLGVSGILFTSLGRKAGLGFPDWYDAGKEYLDQTDSPISLGTLIFTELLLFGWVETMRLYDLRNPGSQATGQFLGVTDGFKSKENGYPGGLFDPFGFSRGDEKIYQSYKVKEIKNARLAMVAFVGFIAQHHATGKSPIDNLVDHLAAPTKVTFATNGVSVPHFSEFN